MSVRIYAVLFGILFLVVGILGYVPTLAPRGYLLNTFTANMAQNGLHIITGIIGLIVAFNFHYARMYFRVFGVIYLFIAVLAFLVGSDFVYMRLNHADNLFHLIVGAIFVYLGFGKPRQHNERSTDLVEESNIRPTDRVGKIDEDSTKIEHTDHEDKTKF